MQGFPQRPQMIKGKNAFKSSFIVNVETDFTWLMLELSSVRVQGMEARAQTVKRIL